MWRKSLFKTKFFYEKIKKSKSDIVITANEREISESLEKFRELENTLNKIEYLTNKFLPEINLKSRLRIVIGDDYKSFFIDIKFLRKDEEKIDFEELTTPEKIFFIIVFYLSAKLQMKKKYILFSNISFFSNYCLYCCLWIYLFIEKSER